MCISRPLLQLRDAKISADSEKQSHLSFPRSRRSLWLPDDLLEAELVKTKHPSRAWILFTFLIKPKYPPLLTLHNAFYVCPRQWEQWGWK